MRETSKTLKTCFGAGSSMNKNMNQTYSTIKQLGYISLEMRLNVKRLG